MGEIEPKSDGRVILRPKRDRSLQELQRRVDVVASERSSTARGEELAGAQAEAPRVLVEEAYLMPVAIGPLEVVAEQLVELALGPTIRSASRSWSAARSSLGIAS